jgi:phage tail sheath protein FI
MPVTPTYPGVYIEEIPSGVRTITPVATAITAFIGSAPRGRSNYPVPVHSFADYTRKFGGLDVKSAMSYAVAQYFQNQGSEALIVRVTGVGALPAKVNVGGLAMQVASPGTWGNKILARIDLETKDKDSKTSPPALFNLFVYDSDPNSRALEEFRNLSIDSNHPRYVKNILEEESDLVRLDPTQPTTSRPSALTLPTSGQWFDDANIGSSSVQAGNGVEGVAITETEILGDQAQKSGLFALENADLFNILCIPPVDRIGDISNETFAKALSYCKSRRAMLFIDSPSGWLSIDQASKGMPILINAMGGESLMRNAAIFFPRLRMSDSLKENRLSEFVSCGAVAGICARTDVARGVWKAPAGIDAGISGVKEFTVKMTDPDNGVLNPLGLNCLRNFRAYGNVVWGSRTLAGSDALGSEWKYLPVRRFALFLEESLYRGTQWAVFEPNDEPLWGQIRLNIGAFMHDLFRQGAFQGRTPTDAYFVKCDNETTTQNDINRGIVNIEVGFAPLKPAEFVIIKFQQMTGKIQT